MELSKVLAKLNRKLDRVRIVQRAGSRKLSLRATLPPKPGESKPKQRYLPTGKPASKGGADEANKLAKRLEAELIEEKFRWADWDDAVAEALRPKNIGELAQELIELKRPQTLERGLRLRYIVPLGKLPQDEFPTEKLLKEVIERECEGYQTKWANYRIAYGMLLDLAGIKHQLNKVGPRAQAVVKPINPADLPTDDLIIETWESIDNPLYRILYARIACYGLRPHESWKSVVSSDANEPFCRVLPSTKTGKKTGGRISLPIPMDWYEAMKPWQDFEPFNKVDWQAKTNDYLGHRVSQWFERRKIPFNAYMLRHAWACRAARKNLSTGVAAKMMGHSHEIHTKTYQQALGKDAQLEAWSNII